MLKVGVTGGIGSGKTTVCKLWEELGAYVLYLDDLAKELMVTNPELISSIKQEFGSESYSEEGVLNREFLAKEAFRRGRIEALNALVHPVLWKTAKEIALQKEEEGVRVFVKEAAILLQNGRPEDLDYVVLVLSDKKERIRRAVTRDQSDEEKIRDRINKQPDYEEYRSLSDFVISNNGSMLALQREAERVFDLIK